MTPQPSQSDFHGEGHKWSPASLIVGVPTLLVVAAGLVYRLVERL